jgi:hypothetical protein
MINDNNQDKLEPLFHKNIRPETAFKEDFQNNDNNLEIYKNVKENFEMKMECIEEI